MSNEAEIEFGGPKPVGLAALRTRVLGVLSGDSENGSARRNAAFAFATRVIGAAVLYLTQALLARWLGTHDFGLYVYAWTLVIIAGDIVPSGFAFAAQRIIPEQRHAEDHAALRGFLNASRLYAMGAGTTVACVAIGFIWIFRDALQAQGPWVLVFAATALPMQALANVQDGVARTFGYTNLALVPGFILRPVMIVAIVAALYATGIANEAWVAMVAASAATWVMAIGQTLVLERRIRRIVPAGPATYNFAAWYKLALGIVASWLCLTLFTYTDVLVLNSFASPADVAVYYASAKTLALTSFVAYAIAAVLGHRFVTLHVADDHVGLADLAAFAVRWTFWPSLAITGTMLAVGEPVLALFGSDFSVGYMLMFILSVGMMARAAVGPAERLLNMLGEQKTCAYVYVAAFLSNLVFCLALVPPFGLVGAAIGSAMGMVVEAVLLAFAVHYTLGLDAFVGARHLKRWRARRAASRSSRRQDPGL